MCTVLYYHTGSDDHVRDCDLMEIGSKLFHYYVRMLIFLSFKFQKWKPGVLIYWPPYLTQDLGLKLSHKRTGGELF